MVKFQSRDALDSGLGREDPVSMLQDCRILRKDELQVRTGYRTISQVVAGKSYLHEYLIRSMNSKCK